MFRCKDQLQTNPPAMVDHGGYLRGFAELTREQWDELGYNEAVPLERKPFTEYTTEWVKGEDLIYREMVIAERVDEVAQNTATATAVRLERDRRLAGTDWTQLKDSTLDDVAMVLWQSYRQALRDVPQQAGFPATIDWPVEPEKE